MFQAFFFFIVLVSAYICISSITLILLYKRFLFFLIKWEINWLIFRKVENLLIEKRSEGRRGIFLLNKKDTCNVIVILKKKNRILKIFSFEIQDFQITGEKCIRNFYNRANHSYESSSDIGFFINSFLLPCCDTSIVKNTRSKKN